jgi:hypothetical protein
MALRVAHRAYVLEVGSVVMQGDAKQLAASDRGQEGVPGHRLMSRRKARRRREPKGGRSSTSRLPRPRRRRRPHPAPHRAAPGFEKLVPWRPYTALLVVLAFSLRRLDDYDTWWHLASGRWIAQHHAIPHTDVLSFTVPTKRMGQPAMALRSAALRGVHAAGASGLVIVSAASFMRDLRDPRAPRRPLIRIGPVAATVLLNLGGRLPSTSGFSYAPKMASFSASSPRCKLRAGGRAATHPGRLGAGFVPRRNRGGPTRHALVILGAGGDRVGDRRRAR